jgi:hypothetical protein
MPTTLPLPEPPLLSDLKSAPVTGIAKIAIDFSLIVPPFSAPGKHETSRSARAHSKHCQTGIAGER